MRKIRLLGANHAVKRGAGPYSEAVDIEVGRGDHEQGEQRGADQAADAGPTHGGALFGGFVEADCDRDEARKERHTGHEDRA